jgi:hypothetical protein
MQAIVAISGLWTQLLQEHLECVPWESSDM